MNTMNKLIVNIILALTIVSVAHAQEYKAAMWGDSPEFGDLVASGSYYLPPNIPGQPNGAFYWFDGGPGGTPIGAIGIAAASGPYIFSWLNGIQTRDLLSWSEWVRIGTDGVAILDLTGIRFQGTFDFVEQAAPPSPPSNTARVFSRDNGSGKTQLCVVFPTGAVQVLATQP